MGLISIRAASDTIAQKSPEFGSPSDTIDRYMHTLNRVQRERGPVRLTVLSNEWIIGGAEIDKLVPFFAPLQKNSAGVKGVSNHGRRSIRDHIGLNDNVNITHLRGNWVPLNSTSKLHPLCHRRLAIHVNYVQMKGWKERGRGER